MYSFPNLKSVCCSMFSSNCCFLTCIQVSWEAGQVVWYSHLLKYFQQFVVIHTVKGFSIFNETNVDVCLEFSCCFFDPTDIGNWSMILLPFLKPAWTSGISRFMYLLKPSFENFEHYFASMWNEWNCVVVWAFFGIALLWDWNENWAFPVLWPLLSFPYFLAYCVQHFHSTVF